ncbi:leucine efflux protein [Acrocarpospora phusangensis]|uniref:Leucine efflux protein n=1 Tax=Acrocarpospora phusangensis TaxID=1070424 RepID=A0A919QH68_9ACTN|nr:leucine efflux protein LeuE [Acrocarpospora phusangensis]GIH27508.1 leucine efflux protein [Acrocarpospora phusangensis]
MFFGITDIWTYVVGAILIILLPGPNSLYVLSIAAQRGVRVGYRAAAGVFVGDTVLMVATAAGAASLLNSSPLLFGIVQYAGAGYLAWIGLNMIRSAWRSRREAAAGVAEAADVSESPIMSPGRPFRKALAISVLNPKAILFFVSFFVQFVDRTYSAPALSFLILGVIIQILSVLYLSALIFSGTYLATQFQRRRALSAGLTTAIGVVFVGFSARLATAGLG